MSGASTDGSLIPAVKAKIVELLRDATWPALTTPYSSGRPGPQVGYSESKDLERERVIVGDTSGEPGDQSWFTFQPSWQEEFELAVGIVVFTPSLTAQEATERAFAMFTVFAHTILEAMRIATPDSPPLGVVGVTSLQVRQPTHADGRTDEGWTCVIDTGIRVKGQLAP